jgi:integrase/recombinase XerD
MQAPLLSAAQWDRIEQHIEGMQNPTMYRLIVQLIRATGLRPIELARVERSWIRGQELRIPTGKSKKGRAGTIPLTAALVEGIYSYMGDRTGNVFLTRTGKAFTPLGMTQAIIRLMERAGVSGSCYSARRGLANRLVDQGVNIAVIQHVLRHADLSTTASYCAVSTNMVRNALYGAQAA